LIKIHKIDYPIRHTVKWKDAPAYKLETMVNINLETFIPLPYIFNIKNSTQLMEDLLDFPFDKDLKFVSFDIENTYSNITVAELKKSSRSCANKTVFTRKLGMKQSKFITS
jgi:hypothetical protein